MVIGRADPPLDLARLRARGQLKEVRVADLRFTVGEASELLHATDAARTQLLSPAVISALAARTEGWAAGLQLAALSLREQTDVEGFVAAFTGSHRYVLDYLTEEVLERQDPEVREFLLETSILDRLCGSLCDAVTERADSQRLLEIVDRAGLFLVQLDDVRAWWRYHHLFSDLLRARSTHDRERTRELHRRAAGWYQQRGLIDDAIHHAMKADDVPSAVRLIEEHFDVVFNLRGEQATIQSWLPILPDEVVRSRPRLLLAQAQMASMRGDLQAVEPLLDAAERVAGAADDEPFEPSSGRAGSLLVNVPAMLALQRSYAAQLRGEPEETLKFAKVAWEHLGPDERMLTSAVEGFLAMAEWLNGRLAEAQEGFESRIGWWRQEGQVTTTAWGDYCIARLERGRGRLDAAALTGERALEQFGVPGGSWPPAAGPALVELAAVAYQRNELDAALDYVTQGISLCREFVHTPPLAAGLATLAWLRHVAGDAAGAQEAMDEAMTFAPGPAGLLDPIPVQRARLMLACGAVRQVAGWVADAGVSTHDAPCFPREPEHLVLVRLLLAQGSADEAVALLDRLEEAAERQERVGSLIEIRTLQALVFQALDDEQKALQSLGSALRFGCEQRYIRVFVDEGPAMADLLARLVARRADQGPGAVPLTCIARVQGAFPGQADAGGISGRVVQLVEPLTPREREILALLASGATNQRIAEQLVVTVDTVKKHVSHVLGKLGAGNRTEAVARGRELGAIDSPV